MSNHTPTPWVVLSQEDDPYEDIRIAGGGRALAKLWLDDAPVHDYNREQWANAAYIVKCVNAHDDLVTALLKSADAWRDMAMANKALGKINTALCEIAEEDARAALAKVQS